MDIRIDEGREEIDGLDEDIYEGEVVEADELADIEEETFIPEKKPEKMPSQPPEKGRSGKKILITITIAILVIIAGFALFIFFPRAPTASTLAATESEDEHGMRVSAPISSESATESSGEAKITISFDGDVVYTKDDWQIKNNNPSITIPYSEFVVANGVYTIDVEFQGVSDTTTYDEVDFVIEDITIEKNPIIVNPNINEITYQPEFTLIAIFQTEKRAPKDSEIRITEVKHDDGIHQVTSGIGDWESVINQGQFQDTIEYDVSGNYTMKIEIRNNDVKSSAYYHEFEVNDTVLLNAAPIAVIAWEEEDGVNDYQVQQGDWVDFDPSGSVDDGDNIKEYKWEFADWVTTEIYEDDRIVRHVFDRASKVDPETLQKVPWGVTLTVTDRGYNGEQKTHLTAIGIVVNP